MDFKYYYENKCRPQVQEITTQYGPIAIVWFDTPGRIPRQYVEELVAIVHKNQPNALVSGRAGYGLAESFYQLGRFSDSLMHFNRLFHRLPENTQLWWKAFIREIQCRRALEQDPVLLYKLIEQKRVFFPELGGAERRGELQQLQRELRAGVGDSR